MSSTVSYQERKVIFLSSLGGMLDFYDFVIFAVFALDIGQSFFPNDNPLFEIMAAFSAFAVGYLARPLGGILFSHFGDKYGRKKSFIFSIIIMGWATLCMGLLPSYHDYGLIMPLIFLSLRVIQGIAIGGEIPGAITYVTEHVKHKPGLACGIIFSFLNLGIIIAHLFDASITLLIPHLPFYIPAWRIAFIIGGLLAIISYFLRTSLEESPEYLSFQHKVHNIPLIDLFKQHREALIVATLIVAIQATLISIIYLYSTSFMQLTKLYSEKEITNINLIGLSLFCLTNILWGVLADYYGHKTILIIGALFLIPGSFFFYQGLLNHNNVILLSLIMAIISGMTTGSFAAVVAKMFPTPVRYSGIGVSYNLAFAIFAGLSPLLTTSLIEKTHNMMVPAYLMMTIAFIGFLTSLFSTTLKEYMK